MPPSRLVRLRMSSTWRIAIVRQREPRNSVPCVTHCTAASVPRQLATMVHCPWLRCAPPERLMIDDNSLVQPDGCT